MNHALQAQYPNLLILAELDHVQCVSTTTCERAFSVQNLVQTKAKNWSNIKAMLQIALDGPDDIISDVVPLWKNDSKYLFCMLIPLLI